MAGGSALAAAPRAFASVRQDLPVGLLPRAIASLGRHGAAVPNHDLIGIADFSRASADPRFHLVDVANGRVAATYLVSHGRGSDPVHTGWLQRFSNQSGSNASSRGSYVTGEAYVGKHGRSRQLHGLDADNSAAFERAIVIHGADYVSTAMVATHGRIGRSQGCFAFSRTDIESVLARLGPGRLLYADR
ncbi:murein L,D-transpeptidase catalytic domain family protein [Sandarakinorhabdus sp.]|uniref:murein L,D-transpeptidase catalytic domain family protein n=1 Tax=Sandarakinorhabdus sp. TaxID=1916663 RepID=UPI00286E004C|nr:murein L,D-transpeptidase catalytic domain family protein [Sandarakinorhabdus sp.]